MENLDLSVFKKNNPLHQLPEENNEEAGNVINQDITEEDQQKIEALQENIASGIEDIDEARDAIAEIRKYISPIISIPEEYLGSIREKGLITAHDSWIPGDKTLAATLGIKPYEGIENEKRILFRIKNHVPIEPRITRKNSIYGFYGIVYVPTEKLDLKNDVEIVH